MDFIKNAWSQENIKLKENIQKITEKVVKKYINKKLII